MFSQGLRPIYPFFGSVLIRSNWPPIQVEVSQDTIVSLFASINKYSSCFFDMGVRVWKESGGVAED